MTKTSLPNRASFPREAGPQIHLTQAWRLFWVLVLFVLPGAAQAQFTSAINDGTVTITGYVGQGGDVVIPAALNGRPVTAIGDSAFLFKTTITSITIPEGVTRIGQYAFLWCRGLTSAIIPGSVTNIGDYAFQDCESLTAIHVDPANSEYSSTDGILFNKAQTRLILYPSDKAGDYSIPVGVTHIVSRAFKGCSQLTSLRIPKSVASIGREVFIACRSLTSLDVEAENPAYSSVEGVLFNKVRTQLIQWPLGRVGTYEIPSGVHRVEDFSFYGSTLSSVTIPASVTDIGVSAFYGQSLQEVFFLGDAPNADPNAFEQGSATLYRLPGTTGWGPTLSGRPTALWSLPSPVILGGGLGLGQAGEGFGFLVSWAADSEIVVEASSSLAAPIWVPVVTNALSAGTYRFSDPQWTQHSARFFRVVPR